MGKFFYKNNNYKKGGKVRYDNGGTTDPDPTPVAIRNINTDYFDPNVSARMNPIGTTYGNVSYSANVNPRFTIGPDKPISFMDSDSRLTLGPSFTTTGASGDVNSQYRNTLGLRTSLQTPIGNKGFVVGGSTETGTLLSGANYINPIGDQRQQKLNLVDDYNAYGQSQLSLGYYPKSSYWGGKAYIGTGSEKSNNPGISFGGEANYGPFTLNVNKNRQGWTGGFGLNLPLGSGTKRVRKTGNPDLDYNYDNGGITKYKYDNGGPINIDQLNETYRRNQPPKKLIKALRHLLQFHQKL